LSVILHLSAATVQIVKAFRRLDPHGGD